MRTLLSPPTWTLALCLTSLCLVALCPARLDGTEPRDPSERPRKPRPADDADTVIDLAAYRESPEYYREPWRPQYHFTPEVHWMNDPNGLVYHDGEYHLFYQYNPFGTRWGHMSWGHAVSRDMVNWRHLPVALQEEDGVMIFSGCCVVDHRNTSGFGKGRQKPMVAIYTGHRSDNQSQHIAYSLDRGRTWTKYAANPVLDIDEKDFRDPKVFWHQPTARWVQVVSLAADKRLQFYTSKNLREWNLASEFGPAGAAEKPNWECPDIFELPIDGEPGETRWVLEVDMGGGSVAGGSGGEYFVGSFDGTRFKSDHRADSVRWVDYGRDFYAPVSFAGLPKADGRRIWIGWINNWETCLLPTWPWRSAQSIPRALSLGRVGDELLLVQRPVVELQTLRRTHHRLADVELTGASTALADAGIRGNRLEIQLVIDAGDAASCGIEVRRGASETTRIRYDAGERRIWVDRTRSGEVDFHPAFAGRHGGPLRKQSPNRQTWHIFVDSSSVEVFADDGHLVITERIFPQPDSSGLRLWAEGGTARVQTIDVWELGSIWH